MGVAVRLLVRSHPLEAPCVEVVVPIGVVAGRPGLQTILEVPHQKVLVLVENDGGGGVFGVNVDDAVGDARAPHPLPDELGDVDELNPLSSHEIDAIVTELEVRFGSFVRELWKSHADQTTDPRPL